LLANLPFSGHPDCEQVPDAKKRLQWSEKLPFIPMAKRVDSVDAVCQNEGIAGRESIQDTGGKWRKK
jgi:hypothetical protein